MKLGEKAKIVEGLLLRLFLRLREDAALSQFDSCPRLQPCLHGATVQPLPPGKTVLQEPAHSTEQRGGGALSISRTAVPSENREQPGSVL